MKHKRIAAALVIVLAGTMATANANTDIETSNKSGTCAWITFSSKSVGDINFSNQSAGWLKHGAHRVDIERRMWPVHRVRAEVMSKADCTGKRIYDTETTWEATGDWDLVLHKGAGNYYFTRDPYHH